MAVDRQLWPGKGVVLGVPFGSAKQIFPAVVQLILDFALQSANGIAETVSGFASP